MRGNLSQHGPKAVAQRGSSMNQIIEVRFEESALQSFAGEVQVPLEIGRPTLGMWMNHNDPIDIDHQHFNRDQTPAWGTAQYRCHLRTKVSLQVRCSGVLVLLAACNGGFGQCKGLLESLGLRQRIAIRRLAEVRQFAIVRTAEGRLVGSRASNIYAIACVGLS